MAVDGTGLTIESTVEILERINLEQRSEIDQTLVQAPEEPMGQVNGIAANSEREVWEALQIAYNGFNPDAAEGFLLDALCALTGTVRRKATYTEVLLTNNIDSGTVLVSGGHFVHVVDHPEIRFTPKEDFTAPSTGNHDVIFRSEELGPFVANAGTLTVIATPVSGWNAVTNALDAELGTNEEQDDALRLRREQALQQQGSGTVGAILSAVRDVDGIVSASLLENTGDYVDADGLLAHSFEVLIFDGETPAADADAIAQAIWDNKPIGIRALGNTQGNALDEDDGIHVVKFSRAVLREVYIDVATSPVLTGDQQTALKGTIVATLEADNAPGKDVIRNEIISAVMAFLQDTFGDTTQVDVTTLELGFGASPSGTTNLTIGLREIADYDTSRIVFV